MENAEAEWIVRAQNGDDDAFENLVRLYQAAVYNLCFRMLGSHEEAEDAAQEAFLRAYQYLRRYDCQRPFANWLLSIAAHYCIDQIRKRHIKIVDLEDLKISEMADPSPNPEAIFHLNENQARIRNLLGVLDAIDRSALIMCYWYDFSYEEIAEALHLTVSAVKSRLYRAKRELAKYWLSRSDSNLSVEGVKNESRAL